MSTQEDNGIPLTILPEESRDHFRLLELPAEILSILTSENPPILELKSSDASPAGDKEGNAVLCTPNRTFNVRQKNSSNSVYILQTSTPNPDTISTTGVEAIAQCHSTLELTACTNLTAAVAAPIKRILPMYTSSGDDNDIDQGLMQHELFDQIPFSEQECRQAYRSLAVFEHPHTGKCHRPSAEVKTHAWREILETALVHKLDLAKPLDEAAVRRLTERDGEIDASIDSSIAKAVIDAVSNQDPHGCSQIEADLLVQWIGLNALEADAAHKVIPLKMFDQKWKDLLPEGWRSLSDVAKLKGHYRFVNDGKDIAFDSSQDHDGGTRTAGAGTKRNWHEVFRPSQKAKR